MKTNRLSFLFVASLAGLAGTVGLSGCSANFGDVSDTPEQVSMHIQGIVHGGQQSLNGAHIYMYAASTGAYGGAGIAASTTNASRSLLTAAAGAASDANGNYYVTTDVQGNFNINGAFACTPGSQIYLYSSGGDPQLGGFGVQGAPNPAATLLAVVGPCASATPSSAFPGVTFVFMNEVSTVATAYALAGFATDPLHIGAPSAVTGHSLSATGIANAFSGALNITNQATGLPVATTPAGNGTVPVTTINALADTLAVCVNSTGASSTGCSSLFANTKNSSGTAPADTAAAAINIAQHPGTNVSNLLNLVTSTGPFQPTIASSNDLALGIKYTASGLTSSYSVSIDSTGNVWVANYESGSTIYALTPLGALVTGEPAGGYGNFVDAVFQSPTGVLLSAIDTKDNVWTVSPSAINELSNGGTAISQNTNALFTASDFPKCVAVDGSNNVWIPALSGSTTSSLMAQLTSAGKSVTGSPFTLNGFSTPVAAAIDGLGNVWTANNDITGNFASPGKFTLTPSIAKISATGTSASGSPFTGNGISTPQWIAIDSANNAWVTNFGSNSVTELNNAGTALSGTTGYSGGGISRPTGIAIDGAGNAWITNAYSVSSNNTGNGSITELSSTGTVLSGAAKGYTGNQAMNPQFIALDGSGNAWVTNFSSSITEFLGLAAPVVTPLAANLASPYSTPASKP